MFSFNSNQDNSKDNSNNKGQNNENKFNITPSQAIVIGGILCGALDVDSVLVDKNQEVQIVLVGSLKQKTQLEKIMEQVGNMPFSDVMKAIMNNLGC